LIPLVEPPSPSPGEMRLRARAAAIYTVIQTCKANGVDPQAYIADVIARIADNWPASRWDELMPWNWMPLSDQPIKQAA
jgi:transposase